MQEIWRSNDLPALLETDALEQHNLSTRTELEASVEAQKTCILEEKRADQLQTQEHARATTHTKERELNASQVEIEVLQAEKSRREPVLKELFEKTVEQDAKLKQLLADSERQMTTQEKQLEELTRGLALYQKLGLFFEHSDGQ
ncbi:hypothetical protein PsorP6_003078 [Peronosclerospora sorghi]|uniref:Uncharacterized protein n=1 Tax=Peronosclerospora sorghi TaxID=230839 RepID=A0ACC0VNL4_9STRA|nr:hypothetical protein PsorP6_003078 [Peronosclerospora sorghi]